MMRPQITRLRSSQNMRQSIRTSLNRSNRLKISILRVYSSRKAFFSLGRRESRRRSVKATTIGAMKTNCKSRWIFWNRMRGTVSYTHLWGMNGILYAQPIADVISVVITVFMALHLHRELSVAMTGRQARMENGITFRKMEPWQRTSGLFGNMNSTA